MACKLSPIVRHQALRHSKPAHNVFPYETFDLVCGDLGHWFCFDPVGEILNCHHQVLHLPDRQRERSQDVDSPRMKRPRAVNRLQLLGRRLVPIGVLLALFATLRILLAVFSHRWPVVACTESPRGQSSTPDVSSAVACNERIISTICAMVMAASPSAATGATGLERLLLMNLANHRMQRTTLTSATIDTAINRKKLCETPQENSRTPQTFKETCNSTRNHRFFHEKKNQTNRRARTPPNKSRVNSRKPHFTEQNLKRTVENVRNTEQKLDEQRTTVAPAHNHIESYENLQDSRCGWERVLHDPTVGA